jgi:hypothetical protein
MRFFVRASLAVLPLVATTAAACGGQSGFSSSFQQGEPPGTAGSDSAGASTGGSTGTTTVSLAPPTGASGGGGTGSSGSADGGSTTIGASCNAVSATASRAPLRLVVMLDRSGSMGKFVDENDEPVDNTSVRWKPVTTALETFFEDPASENVEASLQFFPLGNDQAQCNSNTYASPSVDFTSLPAKAGSDPFSEAIGQTTPNGGTPTIEALAGALTYAIDTMNTDTTGAKYAVVFVTDGDPCSCAAGQQAGCPGFVGSPSDTAAAQAVANLAAKYASVIPTYVIGVGTDFSNLNLIAAGGGTTSAIAVSTTTSPTQTSSDLQTALDKIRTSALSCDFVIPAAPSGQTYDIGAVNVQYTPTGGSVTTLPYDPTCSGTSGWHYDDPTAPTQIILCGSTCTDVQSSSGGAVNVAFGCDTVGGIPGYDGGIIVR